MSAILPPTVGGSGLKRDTGIIYIGLDILPPTVGGSGLKLTQPHLLSPQAFSRRQSAGAD